MTSALIHGVAFVALIVLGVIVRWRSIKEGARRERARLKAETMKQKVKAHEIAAGAARRVDDVPDDLDWDERMRRLHNLDPGV